MTPQEEDKFKDFSAQIQTPHGSLTVLRKSESGNCIFYDAEKNICKSYWNRPFECRAYPLLIHFSDKIGFKLDGQVCPKIKECSPDEIKKTKQKWLEHHLPLNWIKAYSEFD